MQSFNPHKLDVSRFCHRQSHLEGATPAQAMSRIHAAVRWQIQGALQGAPPQQHPLLYLQAQADVVLTCQRCLQAMSLALKVERRFLFAPSEALAARWDSEQELGDNIDVLAITRSLDVPALVEDELLLLLPYAPMHEHCSAGATGASQSGAADVSGAPNEAVASTRAHPFAQLARLRTARSKP